MKTINLILTLILLLCSYFVNAQGSNPFGFDCVITGVPEPVNNPVLPGGVYKPESIIDYTNDPNAYFPVLIVYVQFHNDEGPDVSWWPRANDVPPTFMGDVIATEKRTSTNWWEAYDQNSETLSDYWMEVSRGKLHLVGREVHVVLQEKSYYENFGSAGRDIAMEDLFNQLATEVGSDWPNYDLWKKDGNTFVYGQRDGYVDMLYIVARSNPCSQHWTGSMGGYFRPNGVRNNCTHGWEHTVYNSGGIEIKLQAYFGSTGSGFQVSNGHGGNNCSDWVTYAPMEKLATISFTEHEHGHYLVGDDQHYWEHHLPYSKINNYAGPEEFLSPYELFRFGYHEPQVVDFVDTDYPIGDWTSRESNESQILKVPIGTPTRNEFFIIANRQKESFYDRIMWGDTCRGDPYFDLGAQADCGKGTYIYHAYPGEVSSEGYPWSIHIDQECADGLWDWAHTGFAAPDWDPNNPWLPVYTKTRAVYDLNDITGAIYYNPDGLNNRDGKSVSKFFPPDFHHVKWFSIGKKETQQNGTGMDRVYTNLEENWTSREFQGDRWDAWKPGYNEVFSPYSSPSTLDWDNQQTGIFIYLQSQVNNTVNIKIYKAVQFTPAEATVLAATPPSRPMLYKPVEVYDCNGSWGYPRVAWDNNMEPDMLRTQGFKRYKIYRAGSTDEEVAPYNYVFIGYYNDYTRMIRQTILITV